MSLSRKHHRGQWSKGLDCAVLQSRVILPLGNWIDRARWIFVLLQALSLGSAEMRWVKHPYVANLDRHPVLCEVYSWGYWLHNSDVFRWISDRFRVWNTNPCLQNPLARTVLCGPGILPGGAVLAWRPLESSVFSTLNRHVCISLGKHTGLWMFFVCGLAQPGQLPARAELQSTAGLICLIWSLLNARLPGWLMWAPGGGGLW